MADARADQWADESGVKRTDAELAAASGQGDPAAFGELVSRHQDRAFNLAFRLTGSREDAADAVQEAFLKAYRGMPSFRRQSSFYTWLFRIVVNEVRSRRRSRSSRLSGFSLDAGGSRPAGLRLRRAGPFGAGQPGGAQADRGRGAAVARVRPARDYRAAGHRRARLRGNRRGARLPERNGEVEAPSGADGAQRRAGAEARPDASMSRASQEEWRCFVKK